MSLKPTAYPMIKPADLLSLEEYKKRHLDIRREIIAIRDLRRVEAGPHVSFTFENRRTVIYQIQEMIRVEHLTDPAKIRDEIEAYKDLLPRPDELSATMFIEISDAAQREKALSELGGIEKKISLTLDGKPAPARDKRPIDPRFERPGRASAVYYLGFPLAKSLEGLENARLEITHPRYGHTAALRPETLAALAQDLEG
jgi:hypothetical protein